jgi:hypothetical protein
MKWMAFFKAFFKSEAKDISKMLDAGGCREGWLQGELFLRAPHATLQTNATRRKYDLYSKRPAMVAEVKICGGDYQSKMQALIESDVQKLRTALGNTQRFMILLVDTRCRGSSLGKWLLTQDFPHTEYCDVKGTHFTARIWKIRQTRRDPPLRRLPARGSIR